MNHRIFERIWRSLTGEHVSSSGVSTLLWESSRGHPGPWLPEVGLLRNPSRPPQVHRSEAAIQVAAQSAKLIYLARVSGAARPSSASPLEFFRLDWTNPLLNNRHRMRQGHPLNLSISLSGGKETNQDAPSNGE